MSTSRISHAAHMVLPGIECDLTRRLCLAGLGGALLAGTTRPLLAKASAARQPIVTPDGISRTTLESYANEAGDEFRLVLNEYPPGVGLPIHHHPSVAHNYVLEGVAESQYEGEGLRRFTAGESYQDKAQSPHLIFRNGDGGAPLKYLIAYTVRKGQPFLIVP
jgi:quercetin dioxygenase-like cupin family protein